MLSVYSRAAQQGKRHVSIFLLVFLAASASAFFAPALAQSPHKIVIPRASRLVLGHLGIHTDANYLLFDTDALDLSACQRDPLHYSHLTFKAHSSLPTNHAALPPDLAAFGSPGDPPLQNPYGPIDGGPGKSGWTLLPGHENGRNIVKALVPTRFANWLAAQSPARRRQYAQPNRYTLTITWNSPPS